MPNRPGFVDVDDVNGDTRRRTSEEGKSSGQGARERNWEKVEGLVEDEPESTGKISRGAPALPPEQTGRQGEPGR